MAVGVGDSICEVLRRLFPGREAKGRVHIAPPSPPDVFAAAAYLLQISGAYHHVQPDNDVGKGAHVRILHVTKRMRDKAKKIGKEWRNQPLTPFCAPDKVQKLWTRLWTLGDKRKHNAAAHIFQDLAPSDACPLWWSVALELFLIADSAAADDVGWLPPHALRPAWLPVKHIVVEEERIDRGLLSTIAFETNQDMVSVLPKARTPAVGCTLRSLSHHLALLPPRGVARAYWVSPYGPLHKASDALNILIVPFPYHVTAKSFLPKSPQDVVDDRHWGWFCIDPSWLKILDRDDFTTWIESLVKRAMRDCGHVHGVVLPELALDWDLYLRIRDILNKIDAIEFFVSGVHDYKGRDGNFVAMTIFGRGVGSVTTRVREKHHRWKLESRQIGGYAISSALFPTAHWWEKLDILSRSIDVFVFREDSCMTTLICEDLARVDPCQELVRSIGPNLVIALLMDSAQIKDRWPARYATVLAEDPGSSVLTVTSRALVDRFNDEGSWERSNSIALWRDDAGLLRPIDLPPDHDAILLTLAGHKRTSHTLDGRAAPNSISWRYHGQQPIRAEVVEAVRRRIWGSKER